MLVSYCANFAPQGQNSRLCAAARRSYCSHSPLCSLVKPLLIPPFPQPVDPLPPPSNSHPQKISKIENSKIIFSKFRYFSEFSIYGNNSNYHAIHLFVHANLIAQIDKQSANTHHLKISYSRPAPAQPRPRPRPQPRPRLRLPPMSRV